MLGEGRFQKKRKKKEVQKKCPNYKERSFVQKQTEEPKEFGKFEEVAQKNFKKSKHAQKDQEIKKRKESQHPRFWDREKNRDQKPKRLPENHFESKQQDISTKSLPLQSTEYVPNSKKQKLSKIILQEVSSENSTQAFSSQKKQQEKNETSWFQKA